MNIEIDPLLHEEVRPLLEPGEGVLWADRPDPFRFARARVVQSLFGVLFFLFLAAFAGRAGAGTTVNAGPLSIPFRPAALTAGALFSLYWVFLPALAYRKALRTLFAVTDRRVLALTPRGGMRSMRFAEMQAPVLDLLAAGTGDIRFPGQRSADGSGNAPGELQFAGVRKAEDLYQLVQKKRSCSAGSGIASGAVLDYLDLLARGQRTLDVPRRKADEKAP